jgi:CheY-like chemotaxis protein
MNGKTILLVEDEFLVALDMQTILADAGFHVLGPAGNVDEAIGLIGRRLPDAALLDNNLHGQSVAPVAATLTERGVPFAFVTGNDRDSLPSAFIAAPVVRKPFDAVRLVEMVRRLAE